MSPEGGPSNAADMTIPTLRDRILPLLRDKIPADKARWTPRADVAREAKIVTAEYLAKNRLELNLLDQRDLVTSLVNGFLAESAAAPAPAAPSGGDAEARSPQQPRLPHPASATAKAADIDAPC